MKQEEIIWLLEVMKVYVAQDKDVRNKLKELFDSIDKELNKNT